MSGGRIRRWWLLIPGVGGQVAADHLASGRTAQIVLIASYAVLALLLWANRLLVGIGLMAVGLAANAAVVIADNGMPVNPAAIVSAGLAGADGPAAPPTGARHHLERPDDQLVFLDDRLPLRPVHRVVSFGDVLLVVGGLDVLVHLVLDSWEPRRLRPDPRITSRTPGTVRSRAAVSTG